MGFYLRVVVALIIAMVLYGGLLPHLVSAKDTILVLIGIASALIYPAFAGKYLLKHYRKTFNA